MISVKHKGNFAKLNRRFEKIKNLNEHIDFNKYGKAGVEALKAATPKDTGKTASSWFYEIKYETGKVFINFMNSNINQKVPIAIIIQYGHGTGTGGWVDGIDYINPTLSSVFENLKNDAWKEVTQ